MCAGWTGGGSITPTSRPTLCSSGPVGLWENSDSQLVAYVLAESASDAHLQVHPDYRYLEDELVAWAEDHLGSEASEGGRQLEIYTYEYDALRRQTLAAAAMRRWTTAASSATCALAASRAPPSNWPQAIRYARPRPMTWTTANVSPTCSTPPLGARFTTRRNFKTLPATAPCFRGSRPRRRCAGRHVCGLCGHPL